MATITGTWIYEKGSASGGASGGGGEIDDAPPVHPDSVTVTEIYNGDFELDVYWTADPTATPQNFRGVAVYIEDPDISSGPPAALDGSIPLSGTAQASGLWKPIRTNDSFKSPAVFTVKGQYEDRNVRIYLAAFAQAANPQLYQANDPVNTPTPNIVALVPKMSPQYVSGQEYAWNVTGAQVVQVDDFDNAAGPQYTLYYNYTKPDPATPLPPGMAPFGGVEIYFQYDINDPNTQTDAGQFLPVDQTGPWPSTPYPVGASTTFRVWFVSRDINGKQNSIVTGVTPSVDVTVTYPPAGEGGTPGIIAGSFVITPLPHVSLPDGTVWAEAKATWQVPDSPRYAGSTFYRINPLPVRQMVPATAPTPVEQITFTELDWPKAAAVPWTIAAIAYDFDGHAVADPMALPLPAYVETAIWNIGPPGAGSTGGEYIGGQADITSATVTTVQQLNSDGVVMMQHVIQGWVNPTDNGFGGISIARVYQDDIANATWWDVPANATSITTPWEPAPTTRDWKFYFVARNLQNQRNTIFAGVTPMIPVHFDVQEGDVLASRLPQDWFNTSEFQWTDVSIDPNAKFSANLIAANKIQVGSILRVGGGSGSAASSFAGNQDGQIGVFNKSNVLRAWMGEQSTTTPDDPSTGHSVFGGWFAELYVGGDSPVNAPLYATQNGAVIVGGFAAPGPGRYPYISIRKDTGLEVGRIGAALGYPESVDPASQQYISGAWFREFALGGQSLNDWQVLLTIDKSNPTMSHVQMRNIDLFSIDYVQNYSDPTYPNNAANRLQFGYTAYVTGITDPSSAYKFPGITLMRSGTSHGIEIINRGIVLSGTQGKLGAFVTYNGQTSGADLPEPFWCVLTMYSPMNLSVPVVTLQATSAAHAGSAYMELRDVNNKAFFRTDDTNPILVRQGINTANSAGTEHPAVIDTTAGAQWVGAAGINTTGGAIFGANGISTTGDIKALEYFAGTGVGVKVIDSGGNWVGPGSAGGGGGTLSGDIHVGYIYTGPDPGTPSDVMVIDKYAATFVGKGVNCTAAGSTIRTVDDVHGRNIYADGPDTGGNDPCYVMQTDIVINKSRQFTGAGGVNSTGGAIFGANGIQTTGNVRFGNALVGSNWNTLIDVNSNINGNAYYVNNYSDQVIKYAPNVGGQFVGAAGVNTTGGGIFGDLGIQTNADIRFGRTLYGPNWTPQINPNGDVIATSSYQLYNGGRYDQVISNTGNGQFVGLGGVNTQGEIIANANLNVYTSQVRLVWSNYGVLFRNDGMRLFILLTDSGNPFGSWRSIYPFVLELGSGDITMGGNVTVGGNLTCNSQFNTAGYSISGAPVINNAGGGQFIGPGGVNTTGGGIFGGAGVSTSGDVSARQYWVGSSVVINTNGQFSGPNGVYTTGGGVFGVNGVSTSGAMNASQYLLNNAQSINTANQFVGSGGVSTGGVINGSSYNMSGSQVISNYQFVGFNGVSTTGGAVFGGNGVSTSGDISASGKYHCQGQLGATQTVNVSGVTLRFVGGIFMGSP